MPGFTHLQVAQPVTFGHHLLAYVEMFGRDAERMADCRKRVNRLPLGAAALAGTSFPIDRERVAKTLGFDDVCRNSLDAVSDRDFAIEFCAAAALVMMHVSRMSEELVLWMSPRFGFIDIADRFCTGSSIMPQKKNPDVPELARGKTGRVDGHLIALLTLMKGQPLAYNKDNQEDKEPLFDTVDTRRRHAAHLRRHGARHHGQGRRDARGGAAGLRDRDRPGRLPGQEGPAVPRRARSGRARGARLRDSRLRPDASCRWSELQRIFAADRRRRLRRADAGRLGRGARPCRRHRARAGARGDRPHPRAVRLVRNKTTVLIDVDKHRASPRIFSSLQHFAYLVLHVAARNVRPPASLRHPCNHLRSATYALLRAFACLDEKNRSFRGAT